MAEQQRDAARAPACDTLVVDFHPTVWSAPWTGAIYGKRAKGEIFEYACQEGMRGMLSAARTDEGATR